MRLDVFVSAIVSVFVSASVSAFAFMSALVSAFVSVIVSALMSAVVSASVSAFASMFVSAFTSAFVPASAFVSAFASAYLCIDYERGLTFCVCLVFTCNILRLSGQLMLFLVISWSSLCDASTLVLFLPSTISWAPSAEMYLTHGGSAAASPGLGSAVSVGGAVLGWDHGLPGILPVPVHFGFDGGGGATHRNLAASVRLL